MKNYLRYACVILAVPAAVLLRFALLPLIGPGTPYITLFPVTVIVAVLAGMGPAILTGVLSAIAIDYFIISPLYAIELNTEGISRMTVMILTSIFVGYVGNMLRKAKYGLEVRVRERTAELMKTNEFLRLEEARLDALLQLSQKSEATLDEITSFTLEQAIKLTQSKIGFVGFLSEDEKVYTLHSVSKDVVKECSVVGNPMHWPVDDAGIWADAIQERKTLFVNDYSKPHPRKKGIPAGHVPIERFMVVPFLDGKRIVTIAGVGNKASDYEKSDERQVALLLSGMWNCVQKSRSMERLEKAYSELEDRVKERTGELAASTAALLESQKDLNRAQAVAHTGSWRLDVQRNELMWSDEAYKIFGIPKGTLLTYETFLDCVHPEDRKYVNQKWREAMRGKMYDIEHRIAADGQIKWVRERAELEFEKDGTLLGGFGTVTDITRRKEMEEALREAKEGLEIKVAERTAELAEAISSLQREMQERVKAEENVEAERKRLYDVLETLPAYVCLLTTDYRMPFANRVFRETFGYSPSEKCYEFLFNRTEPCEKCETYSILKTNKPHRWKWAGPNGRDYDVFDFPFKDTNRSQLILEMGIDITELKRSEIRTNVTNTLLGLFVQKTTKREYLDSVVRTIRDWSGCQCIGIRLTDSEGRIPYESHTGFSEEFIALENMLSLKKDSCTCVRVISQKPEPLSSPVTTSRGSFHCNNSLNFINSLPEKSRARYRGNCMRFGFASLAVVPIRYRDKVLGAIHLADKEEGKMPLDAVEFLEDIAALIGEAVHRFNVEESLRLNERRLSEAQELAHLGNWELDMTGNKLWWSDEGYRIFGLEPKHSETTYEHFLSYVHSDDRKLVEESVSKALNEGKEFDIDHRIIRTDGSERVVNVKAEVVYDSNHKPVKVVGTLHDITEQIKAENEILENQRSLRALAAELQIVEEQERRRIAQDLHDSIGQILSFSGRELKNLQKSVSEKAAKTLQEVANQLDNAVEQTRTLSFDLSPSTLYDLGLEVAIEDLLDRISQKRNIKCHFKSCESAKPLADDVKVLLYRSARELLINAVKHANASFLKVSLSRSRSDICIKVEDDGRGFDTSILESGSKKAKGFGIFSIRERLNHIGGHMRIESAEGKGTRAILTAPLDIEEE